MDIVDKARAAIETLTILKREYRKVCKNDVVLRDLARFCYAIRETHGTDDRHTAYMNGRRSVWLRVQQMLNLTPEQLSALYSGGQIKLVMPEKDKDNG